MDLSNCVEVPDCPYFIRFWDCVKKSYKGVSPSYGARKHAFKAWMKYPLLHNNKCTDEMCKRVITMTDIYKKNTSLGVFAYLPHISSWLNGEKWAQEEIKTKPVTKKLATDRPMPEMIKPQQHKQHTQEERESMQGGFKDVMKGVRRV